MPDFFTEATFTFLADLARNNEKDWFEANRDRYEAHWRAPALDFVTAIADRMRALDPPHKAEAKLNGSLRRINRDTRFSKDKTPYNARLHLIFWTGDHPNRSAGVHLVLNPDGVGYGAGTWALDGPMLARYRNRVLEDTDRTDLTRALAAAESIGCTLGDPDLAKLPRGYDATGKTADLLRYKVLVARTHDRDAEPEKVIGAGGVDWALGLAQTLAPFNKWVSEI